MLGVSRPSYVNVDSPNLGFPFFTFVTAVAGINTPALHHPVSSPYKFQVQTSQSRLG